MIAKTTFKLLRNRVFANQVMTRGFASNMDKYINADLSNVSKVASRVVKKSQDDLTPFQRWCTSGGVERAYTGDLWHEREVGTYHCIGCEKELFR